MSNACIPTHSTTRVPLSWHKKQPSCFRLARSRLVDLLWLLLLQCTIIRDGQSCC